jgi:hypothetical protein
MKPRIIIYYESANGVTSNLVEFENRSAMKECTDIIDGIEEGVITYLELQNPPAAIKQPYLEGAPADEP